MTAVSYVMERARALFNGSQRDVMTTLASTLSNVATSVQLTDTLTGIVAGTLLDIEGETLYVTSTAAAPTYSVIRGQRGSTAVSHANGTAVRSNPRIHGIDILNAINEELADLCSPASGLFRPEIISATVPGTGSLSLAPGSEMIEVRSVQVEETASAWVDVSGWRLNRHPLSATFTAGLELRFRDWSQTGRPVEVVCATEFIPVADTADDVEGTSGLAESAIDLLSLGVAIRCSEGREIARNLVDGQGDTRRAGEVPAGANNAAPAGLRARRQKRLLAEQTKLNAQYPRVRAR